jgi:hypothetical protein
MDVHAKVSKDVTEVSVEMEEIESMDEREYIVSR